MAFMEHALTHLAVRIPQGPPHPVEVQRMHLGFAVLHERLEGVHAHPRIAHCSQWPGDIT
jgi:hypothetical protein